MVHKFCLVSMLILLSWSRLGLFVGVILTAKLTSGEYEDKLDMNRVVTFLINIVFLLAVVALRAGGVECGEKLFSPGGGQISRDGWSFAQRRGVVSAAAQPSASGCRPRRQKHQGPSCNCVASFFLSQSVCRPLPPTVVFFTRATAFQWAAWSDAYATSRWTRRFSGTLSPATAPCPASADSQRREPTLAAATFSQVCPLSSILTHHHFYFPIQRVKKQTNKKTLAGPLMQIML